MTRGFPGAPVHAPVHAEILTRAIDLAVVDLELEKVVRAEDLRGMSDFSPFEGKALRGWPVATIKAGKLMARDGEIVGEPSGRYLARAAP